MTINKNRLKIIDTFNDFSSFWEYAYPRPLDEQIRLWQTQYMGKYPYLLNKQIQCYENEGIEWQDIARRILPELSIRLRLMRKARNNILTTYISFNEQTSQNNIIDFDIVFVIYVGIGCGAGWATTYDNQPAILLGLENIAEEKWHTKNKISGLISHETGHLIHMKWRDEWDTFTERENDPLFRLYSEGFAQRYECILTGKSTWHLVPNREWINWCKQNTRFLANEFLKRINSNDSVKDFFGSWFDILGKKQTGYYLGYLIILEMEKKYSLREIALLTEDDIKKLVLYHLNIIGKS